MARGAAALAGGLGSDMGVVAVGDSEGTGLAGRRTRSAGLDSSRRLGFLCLPGVALAALGSGLNILLLVAAVVVGPASAAYLGPTFPTLPTPLTWWTTWSGCVPPTSSRAEGPRTSLFATGQGVARRRRYWKRQHLAGSCWRRRTGLAEAAASGLAGIRPFLPGSASTRHQH